MFTLHRIQGRSKHGYQQSMTANTMTSTAQYFDHSKQTRRLFFLYTLRWLCTVLFSSLIIATLKVYERKGNLTPSQKNTFNVIITALGLGLGLNFFVSLNFIENIWRLITDDVIGSFQRGG